MKRVTQLRRPPVNPMIWLFLGLVLVCLMPHNQSLWIDESTTAMYAQSQSFSAFVDKLLHEVNSDSQFPLGVFYFWAGSRVVGNSEIALRMLSSLWIAAAVVILWRVGLLTRTPYLPVLFACNAFAWYYGGEARPYAMQIGLSSGLLYALVLLSDSQEKPTRGLNALLLFGPLLCATCMLAVVPVFVVTCICIVVLMARDWTPERPDWAKIMIAGGITATIGCYYAWTLAEGKGAQTVGKWGVGLKNLVICFYELLGFVGFGPGRYEMRELGLAGGISGAIQGFARPLMAGIVVLTLLYMWTASRTLRSWPTRSAADRRLAVFASITTFASAGLLFVLARWASFPFWGRHAASLLPFLVFLLAVAARPDDTRRALDRVLPIFLGATLLASSLIVRFHPDHSRDDYRSFSRIAIAAVEGGQTVWWAASSFPAVYYGVRFCEPVREKRSPCVLYAANMIATNLKGFPRADVIVLSKPDLHDANAAIREYVIQRDYVMTHQGTAFQMFEPRNIQMRDR